MAAPGTGNKAGYGAVAPVQRSKIKEKSKATMSVVLLGLLIVGTSGPRTGERVDRCELRRVLRELDGGNWKKAE